MGALTIWTLPVRYSFLYVLIIYATRVELNLEDRVDRQSWRPENSLDTTRSQFELTTSSLAERGQYVFPPSMPVPEPTDTAASRRTAISR